MHRQFTSFVLMFLIGIACGTPSTCDPTSTCGCSVDSSTLVRKARIIGGDTVRSRAWGWMVSLQLNGVHKCGATLLTDSIAITAAHCLLTTLNPSNYSILAGTNYLDDKSTRTIQRRVIEKIDSHPDFDRQNLSHDIALVRFSSLSMRRNSTLSVICLPSDGKDPFETNTNLVTIGWGRLRCSRKNLSNSLQQVTVPVVAPDSEYCQQARPTHESQHICAGTLDGRKDTYQGDSGGPIMSYVNNRWVLAGITSGGSGCALIGYPGLYTRVSSFIAFIESVLDANELILPK